MAFEQDEVEMEAPKAGAAGLHSQYIDLLGGKARTFFQHSDAGLEDFLPSVILTEAPETAEGRITPAAQR